MYVRKVVHTLHSAYKSNSHEALVARIINLRFPSAVIFWHCVVPKSSDQTPSVSLESYWRRICHLTVDKHVTAVSAKWFFQLRQLRRIRRSLNDDSAATLVQAFVASRVDYCGSLFGRCAIEDAKLKWDHPQRRRQTQSNGYIADDLE